MYKLPADRLYVTYFEGDPANGLEPDDEAREFWLAQGVPESRILRGNAKDNFWGNVHTPPIPLASSHSLLHRQKWVRQAHAVLAARSTTID